MLIRRLISRVDGSVNYVYRYGSSLIESRYVRRTPHVISVYVSSHNGCRMQCQFCWLTAQNQTHFQHVDIPTYITQVSTVLNQHIQQHADEKRDTIRININFMSRGEALANKYVMNHYDELYDALHHLTVSQLGYESMKINLSTIMPHTITHHRLSDIFKYKPVNMYYSLYSISPTFREKWIPNAIQPTHALDKLKQLQLDYQCYATQQQQQQQQHQHQPQQHQQQQQQPQPPQAQPHVQLSSVLPTSFSAYIPPINFHWSFIAGENDNESDIHLMLNEIHSREFINNKFNLVRFNPHSKLSQQGYHEPTEEKLTELFNIIRQRMNESHSTTDNHRGMHPSRIIPRAGPDVYASCGMFLDDHDI